MGLTELATRYWIKSKRLLFKSTKRPTRKELTITSRIVALGILFIGFIGFILDFVVKLFVNTIQV